MLNLDELEVPPRIRPPVKKVRYIYKAPTGGYTKTRPYVLMYKVYFFVLWGCGPVKIGEHDTKVRVFSPGALGDYIRIQQQDVVKYLKKLEALKAIRRIAHHKGGYICHVLTPDDHPEFFEKAYESQNLTK